MSTKMTFDLPFEKAIRELERQLEALEADPNPTAATKEAVRNLRVQINQQRRQTYENLDPWNIVKYIARNEKRPQTLDYIELVFDEFIELHGDRAFGDDHAMVTGFAKLEDQKVLVVGQHKGRTLKEREKCYYGCAHPEGYRKALQKMTMAAKYRIPIICLIDTPGAYPGIGAEERGQAYSIALNLRELSQLPTPMVCVVIGEGGSGGALGIGMGDHVAILQFAYYSVISPEGCAGILWKDGKRAEQAARALKLTSSDLLRLKVVDEVIPEPLGGAHRDHRAMAATLKQSLVRAVQRLSPMTIPALLERRYEKFRRIGVYEELAIQEAASAGSQPDPGDLGPGETWKGNGSHEPPPRNGEKGPPDNVR